MGLMLSGGGYKILKTVHILSSSVWIGAGAAGLLLLTALSNKDNLTETLSAVHNIDLFIIVPANIATFISGVIFSKFTVWGFLRHRWIIFKFICAFALQLILLLTAASLAVTKPSLKKENNE